MRFFTLILISMGLLFGQQSFAAENATISGYKFNDLNGNGIDDNEPRLAGFTINVTNLGGETVELSMETDGNGRFRFDDLPVQSYLVCEELPEATPAWVPTTPVCVTVNFGEKDLREQVEFGNRQPDEEEEEELGCTRTQGYWGSSPEGQARLIVLVPGTMLLGDVAYTASQLDDILDEPTAGNALISLAHQLIAAKLNVLNGADDSGISSTIDDADDAIDDLVIPPVGDDDVPPSSDLGQTMLALKDVLDDYNNGQLGVPHCD